MVQTRSKSKNQNTSANSTGNQNASANPTGPFGNNTGIMASTPIGETKASLDHILYTLLKLPPGSNIEKTLQEQRVTTFDEFTLLNEIDLEQMTYRDSNGDAQNLNRMEQGALRSYMGYRYWRSQVQRDNVTTDNCNQVTREEIQEYRSSSDFMNFVHKVQASPMIQNGTASALERIEQKLDDMNTIDVPMSEVTMNFTKDLLDDLNISYNIHQVNSGVVGGSMQRYQWGEDEYEREGQPACQNILKNEILPLEIDGELYGIYDIRGHILPELQGGKRKSNGFSDMAVGPKTSMDYAATFAEDLVLSYAVAVVELKTGRAALKQGQLLLQLIALSMISNMGQGAVVLGTDCATKWRLLHFSSYNNIVVQPYSNGKKCLADYKKLIAEGAARMQQNAAPKKLTIVAEGSVDDEIMAGFGLPENSRDAAISREHKLRKLAGALGSLFGENVEVPYWAKASETCPSYYM